MGVDVAMKIRIFENNPEDYNEAEVTDVDNSFANMFWSDEIRHTSIKFDLKTEISEEEFETIQLIESEEEEMMAYSDIIDSAAALEIFGKVYRKLYKRKTQALIKDLTEIDALAIAPEEKDRKKDFKTAEYFGFENSFSLILGILKTAKAFSKKIQLVAEFY